MPIELQGGGNLQDQSGNDLNLQGDGSGPFAITEQPQSQDVYDSQTALFIGVAVDPAGQPISYQWFNAVDDTPIAGETSNHLSLGATLNDDGNSYYLQATAGAETLQTDTVTLSVQSQVEQALPGDQYGASYPEFFPCATWDFSQAITGHHSRTEFESGWIRQRKPFREELSTGSLTFTMPTDVYHRWNRWMLNNGYRWFTLHLDVFHGVQSLYEVRLVGPMTPVYRAFDTITVRVPAELGAQLEDYSNAIPPEQPDANSPPGFGAESDPPGVDPPLPNACQPYSCSAIPTGLRYLRDFQAMEIVGHYLSPGDNIEYLGSRNNWLIGSASGGHPIRAFDTGYYSGAGNVPNTPNIVDACATNLCLRVEHAGLRFYYPDGHYPPGVVSGLAQNFNASFAMRLADHDTAAILCQITLAIAYDRGQGRKIATASLWVQFKPEFNSNKMWLNTSVYQPFGHSEVSHPGGKFSVQNYMISAKMDPGSNTGYIALWINGEKIGQRNVTKLFRDYEVDGMIEVDEDNCRIQMFFGDSDFRLQELRVGGTEWEQEVERLHVDYQRNFTGYQIPEWCPNAGG